MRSFLALLSPPICFPLLSQILYFYFSVFCSALIRSSYLSFHFSIKGCAWFPSRVQQFLCQMTRSWHHASALHFALHCSALVWDCLGLWIDIQGHHVSYFYPRTVLVNSSIVDYPFLELVSYVSQHTVADIRTVLSYSFPLFTIVAHHRRAHRPSRTLNTPSTPAPIRFFYLLPTGT